MAVLAKKIATEIAFTPIPFLVIKDRRKGIIIEGDIDWAGLSDDEHRSQWIYCKTVLHDLDKEGKIDWNDLVPYFHQYLVDAHYDADDIKAIKKLGEKQISFSILSSAFLLTQGAIYQESSEYLDSSIRKLIVEGNAIVEEKKLDAAPKRSIQDSMKEQLSNLLGDLQGFEDDLKEGLLSWFRETNVPKVHLKSIKEYFQPRLDELKDISTDPDLKEGYSSYKKSEIKKMISWYENLMTDIDSYGLVKTAQRKTRVSKPKSPAKIVSKLVVLKEHEGIIGEKAEKIIGATVLYVYNTKTRKLAVYNASDLDKELTVKGTYVIGFDPKTSYSKTLRKPETQLKEFLSSGKVGMRKFIGAIKGVEGKLNGKLNKDCILLKVY